MNEIVRSIWKDIITPSRSDETPYHAFLIGCGHLLLGSLFAFMFTSWLWIVVPVAYWLLKEWHDLRNGGDVVDGLMDAFFVGCGAASGIPFIVPATVIGVVGIVTLAYFYLKKPNF